MRCQAACRGVPVRGPKRNTRPPASSVRPPANSSGALSSVPVSARVCLGCGAPVPPPGEPLPAAPLPLPLAEGVAEAVAVAVEEFPTADEAAVPVAVAPAVAVDAAVEFALGSVAVASSLAVAVSAAMEMVTVGSRAARLPCGPSTTLLCTRAGVVAAEATPLTSRPVPDRASAAVATRTPRERMPV